ncbi:MAG: hypothetical protein ACKOPM_01180 [Novosphingobium sp.]
MSYAPRLLAIAAALAFATPALAQDIVVKGKPVSETAAELAACLKRNCPPDEDIKASLAHAENLFVSGDYETARHTLRASMGRNRKHGKAYPVQVSDLLRANSRVAEHMGEVSDYQHSTIAMRDTLRTGFGKDDFRTLVAEVEVGDSRAKLGFPEEAEKIYRDIERRALATQQYRVASFARLRLATVARNRFDQAPNAVNRKEFEKRVAVLTDNPLPDSPEFALAGKVLRAKTDRKHGSTASTDALIAEFAAKGGASRPVLLFSEPLVRNDPDSGALPGGVTRTRTAASTGMTNRYGQWVDIGFWIGKDGKVSDVEVLRSAGSSDWAKPVLGNIAKRIYAPLKAEDQSAPGFYMVERYTLTARVTDDDTGTRLRTREAVPRIERLDLTEETAEAPKQEG